MSNADYEHQEHMDTLTPQEAKIRHAVLNGAPKAIFHYIDDRLIKEEGWVVDDSFVWREGRGYLTYSLCKVGWLPQLICTGAGSEPIGYAILRDEVPDDEQ